MAKILFIGDTHLSAINPISRKETREQYRELLLNKLESVRQICLQDNINNVIILGDVFNNNSGIMNSFEVDIWTKFLEFKANGIELYTIIGNHDMLFQNDSEFKGTYLNKAFITGIIKHLDEITIDNIYIKGIDFGKDFIPNDNTTYYSILVGHCFYENERFGGMGNGNLTKQKCLDLNYKAYVLGHDHTPYDIVDEINYKVIRPGSLIRGTSKTCNLYRKVTVAIFDSSINSWEYREIPTKPGKEVFNDRIFIQKEEDLDINIDNLLQNLTASKDMNIYDIIDQDKQNAELELKEEYKDCLDLITKYLEANGIFRLEGVSNDNN